MDILIHMQLPNLELSAFQFWGLKTPFTGAHMDLFEKHKDGSWNHFSSL